MIASQRSLSGRRIVMNRVDWTLLVFVIVGSGALSFIGEY